MHCIGLLNGGPAEQSGVLQTGDILLQVDGITAYGKNHSEVLDLIMGAADTLVVLELQREDTVLTVEIRRDFTSNPKAAKFRAGPQVCGLSGCVYHLVCRLSEYTYSLYMIGDRDNRR